MLDILIDLSKAFDIVHYNIFLRLCGTRNNCRNLSSSYLSNRKQFAQAECIKASKLDIFFTTYIHNIYK